MANLSLNGYIYYNCKLFYNVDRGTNVGSIGVHNEIVFCFCSSIMGKKQRVEMNSSVPKSASK